MFRMTLVRCMVVIFSILLRTSRADEDECNCSEFVEQSMCPRCRPCPPCPACPKPKECKVERPASINEVCPNPCPKQVECQKCPKCICESSDALECPPKNCNETTEVALNTRECKLIPKGYTKGAYDYFKLHITPDDWYHAEEMCEVEGASLAIPNGVRDINVLRAYFSAHPNKIKGLWVGIHDLRKDEEYDTIGGTSLTKETFPSYSYHGNKISERTNCLVLKKTGYFDDEHCTDNLYGFVCSVTLKK